MGNKKLYTREEFENLRLKSAEAMSKAIEKAGEEGDSVGGIIEGIALNVPPGLGEPIFDTLEGDLAKALFAIPAVKGVEFGSGFSAVRKRGSENNCSRCWKLWPMMNTRLSQKLGLRSLERFKHSKPPNS